MSLKIHKPVYTELFKLKAVGESMVGREMTFDELLANMVGYWQALLKDRKITFLDYAPKKKH